MSRIPYASDKPPQCYNDYYPKNIRDYRYERWLSVDKYNTVKDTVQPIYNEHLQGQFHSPSKSRICWKQTFPDATGAYFALTVYDATSEEQSGILIMDSKCNIVDYMPFVGVLSDEFFKAFDSLSTAMGAFTQYQTEPHIPTTTTSDTTSYPPLLTRVYTYTYDKTSIPLTTESRSFTYYFDGVDGWGQYVATPANNSRDYVCDNGGSYCLSYADKSYLGTWSFIFEAFIEDSLIFTKTSSTSQGGYITYAKKNSYALYYYDEEEGVIKTNEAEMTYPTKEISGQGYGALIPYKRKTYFVTQNPLFPATRSVRHATLDALINYMK